MAVRISCIVCTHNRSRYLPLAIESLLTQTFERTQFEIVVVDNHSTDGTSKLVQLEWASQPNFRYVYEPELGLDIARNAGWKNSEGEYVAYLDDDAVAFPHWLDRIVARFDTYLPRPGCVGGPVTPIWESARPVWLADRLISYLGLLDLSDTLLVSDERQVLVGTNMATRRDILEAVGGFERGLDRRGGNLSSNGDTLFQLRAIEKGFSCLYDPSIPVQHHIQPSRISKDWFIHRMYWEGRSEAQMQLRLHARPFLGRLRNVQFRLRQILLSPRKIRDLISPTEDPEVFARKCFLWREVGNCVGLLGLSA